MLKDLIIAVTGLVLVGCAASIPSNVKDAITQNDGNITALNAKVQAHSKFYTQDGNDAPVEAPWVKDYFNADQQAWDNLVHLANGTPATTQPSK